MPDLTTQAVDVNFVKDKLIAMQRQRAHGSVRVMFENGVMQVIDVSLHFKPPSNKEFIEKDREKELQEG